MGLIFDGVDIGTEFSVEIDGASTWNTPERDVEFAHVPGRNGDLIFDNGCWLNVEITYRMLIRSGWKSGFEAFSSWLCGHIGYFRLEDPDRHPGVYRMAEFVGPIEPELQFTTETGVFTVTFNCKPQQFLTSGEDVILSPEPGLLSYKASESGGVYSFDKVKDDLKNRATTLIDVTTYGRNFSLQIGTTAETAPGEIDVVFLTYDSSKDLLNAFCITRTQQITTIPATLTFSENFTDGSIQYVRVCVSADQRLDRFTFALTSGGSPIAFSVAWIVYEFMNPTGFESAPTITYNFPEAFVLNGFAIATTIGAQFPLVIDGAMETCYHDNGSELANMNPYVVIFPGDARERRDFPYLKPGTNTIKFIEPGDRDVYGDVVYQPGNIEITPNWYRI